MNEPLIGQESTFKNVPLYVAAGPGVSSTAGIIVLQEWWGVTDHIKRMTQRFSEQVGALAVTPDLYRGRVAAKPDEASHLMNGLDWSKAMEDVKAAMEYLETRGCKKIGIVGFCMGGALTLASAQHVPRLSAASCFYGIPPANFADPSTIPSSCALQCHFGELDQAKGFSDKASALALKEKLSKSGHDVSEFHLYPDGNHAFMNEDSPAYPYNAKVAADAMRKTVAFFKRHLL